MYNLPIDEHIISIQPNHLKEEMKRYINGFNDSEKTVFIIAKEQLKSSFNIFRSNGFIQWHSNRNNKSILIQAIWRGYYIRNNKHYHNKRIKII